jgi:hypothetical protein
VVEEIVFNEENSCFQNIAWPHTFISKVKDIYMRYQPFERKPFTAPLESICKAEGNHGLISTLNLFLELTIVHNQPMC